MHATHFGLRQRPFPPTPDSAAYYPATSHERALTRLSQGLADGEGVLLLSGETGTGKTLLCHCLVERLGEERQVVFLTNCHFANRAALFQAILFDLSLPYESRGEQEMPAFRYEYELAQLDGVVFHWCTQPVRILGDGGRVSAIECVRTQIEAGRGRIGRNVTQIPGTEFKLEVDMVVRAIGQKPVTEIFRAVSGIELRANGTIGVREGHQTGNPKYFAGGDCVNGGKEVVDAVAEGMAAARGIDGWLGKPRGKN